MKFESNDKINYDSVIIYKSLENIGQTEKKLIFKFLTMKLSIKVPIKT